MFSCHAMERRRPSDIQDRYCEALGNLTRNEYWAMMGFKLVLKLEVEKGEWGARALEQLVMLHYRQQAYDKMMEAHRELLTYISIGDRRDREGTECLVKLLNFMSQATNVDVRQQFYETTLTALEPRPQHERLWFTTHLDLATLWFKEQDHARLVNTLNELHRFCLRDSSSEEPRDLHTQEVKRYTEQRRSQKLQQQHYKALGVEGAAPHPHTMGVVRKCARRTKVAAATGVFEASPGADFYLSWEIMLEVVKHMDAAGRRTWRLVSKAARQDVYLVTSALRPTNPAPPNTAIAALPLPLLAKCRALKRLSCNGLQSLRSVDGLPAGLELLDVSGSNVTDLSPLLRCTGLQQLSAAGMNTRRLIFRRLSDVLRQLTGLQRLDLSNNISADDTERALRGMAPAIQGLTALQDLGFAGNNLGPVGALALAPVLRLLPGLQRLDLGHNAVRAEGVLALAPALQQLLGLRRLQLGGNDMGTAGARALLPALQQLVGLQELDLSRNALGAEGARVLAPALQQLATLRQLDVSYNGLGAGGARALGPALQQLAGLQRLDLSLNSLGAEGAMALVPFLQQLVALQQLDLRYNGLSAEAELDLSVHGLGPEGALALALALQRLDRLRQLGLGGNRVVAKGARALVHALKQLAMLQQLDASDNVPGAEGPALAPALQQLVGLQQVELRYDGLSHQGAGAELELSCSGLRAEDALALVLALQQTRRLTRVR